MNAQHSPGPWRVINNGAGWSASYDGNGCSSYQGIVDADGVVIALAVDQREDHSEPTPERNSALLRAAPDLLQALTALYAACVADGWPVYGVHPHKMGVARAAIAKATGGPQ